MPGVFSISRKEAVLWRRRTPCTPHEAKQPLSLKLKKLLAFTCKSEVWVDMSVPFKKVLVANRGEIAVRIIRACHELGIKTVAVHSTADDEALHVKLASESICIGRPQAKDSYLNIASIMSAALATGCDAIHPGYGFLSENANFAEICKSCGVTFIGPRVETMRIMGNKASARQVADEIGVPTVPGISEGLTDAKEALLIAQTKVGFPVLLKACAGGGGRGMKIVHGEKDFIELFSTAMREVEAAFGDPSLLLERYLERIRHIEVQIVADSFGDVRHVGLRDCSIQRRYQKLIEESPSLGLAYDTAQAVIAAAVKLARHVNYSSLGTMEFLVDLKTKEFFFIEMNTRLQVEHPVTEMVSDIDLVKEQILIAAGRPVSFKQSEVVLAGHAIEVRINAEDPRTSIPSPGLITGYHPPGGHGVRVESALYSGYRVQPYYDSLVSKLIVRGRTRLECLEKLEVALDEYIIEGIHTNIDLHRKILRHEDFRKGNFHTKFLEQVDVFSDED
jgi:acetyl-CoA carboxylase, biotin carboxylase subunit